MKHDNYEARFGRYFNFEKNFWDAPRRLGFLDLYQIGELCCEPGYEVKTHPHTSSRAAAPPPSTAKSCRFAQGTC